MAVQPSHLWDAWCSFFLLSFFSIKSFSNHHKLYIIWKLRSPRFILWKPFWNQTLRYHGNGTLKSYGGLLPLSGRCQVSYYKMHFGLLESKLFIILATNISLERSESRDSIFGGYFEYWSKIDSKSREKFIKQNSKEFWWLPVAVCGMTP